MISAYQILICLFFSIFTRTPNFFSLFLSSIPLFFFFLMLLSNYAIFFYSLIIMIAAQPVSTLQSIKVAAQLARKIVSDAGTIIKIKQ